MTAFRNKLLQHLRPEVISHLSLKPVQLELEREIEYPGNPIRHLFFIEEGLGSMTATFVDGGQVEVGLFGYESVIGISALMGTRKSLNRVYMQIAGYGYSSPIAAAAAEFALNGEFHKLALRYVQAQLIQCMQSAACNAKHDIEQRLARWLLLCADRARNATFSISQQFLADMLGVTRASINVITGELRKQGLIECQRNEIYIPNPQALEKRSCECYRVVQQHLNNYTEFDTGQESLISPEVSTG